MPIRQPSEPINLSPEDLSRARDAILRGEPNPYVGTDAIMQDCRNCNRSVNLRDQSMFNSRDYGEICERCFDDHFTSCDECGNTYHIENLNDGLCSRCNENERNHVDYRRFKALNTFIGEKRGSIIKSLRPFGIELEVQYEDGQDAAKITKEIHDDVGFSTDGSISGNGMEIQTPPASGQKGETLIKTITTSLKSNNFKVDTSCGYHVHLDVKDIFQNPYRDNIVRTLWLAYIAFEDVIISFLPTSRRSKNTYCQPLKNDYHFREIAEAGNMEALEAIWYRAKQPSTVKRAKNDRKHGTRYRGINMHTLFSEAHIEIRYHSGTMNFRKITEWINLHCLFIDFIVSRGGASLGDYFKEAQNLSFNEKTEKFFDFMRKAGMEKSSEDYFRTRQLTFAPKTEAPKTDEANKVEAEKVLSEEKEN